MLDDYDMYHSIIYSQLGCTGGKLQAKNLQKCNAMKQPCYILWLSCKLKLNNTQDATSRKKIKLKIDLVHLFRNDRSRCWKKGAEIDLFLLVLCGEPVVPLRSCIFVFISIRHSMDRSNTQIVSQNLVNAYST